MATFANHVGILRFFTNSRCAKVTRMASFNHAQLCHHHKRLQRMRSMLATQGRGSLNPCTYCSIAFIDRCCFASKPNLLWQKYMTSYSYIAIAHTQYATQEQRSTNLYPPLYHHMVYTLNELLYSTTYGLSVYLAPILTYTRIPYEIMRACANNS